ncbi:MAG: hypothetical protein GY864_15280 [Desulfobacterales bacterium]|nr:hypothetical protein [Desulfobacterales bacterium]
MKKPLIIILPACFFFLIYFGITDAVAGEKEEIRIKIALSIFPKIVAVDKDIDNKLTDSGKIQVLFFYQHERRPAEGMADYLRENISNIAGRPLEVLIANDISSKPFKKASPSAIFLAERLPDDVFKQVKTYGTIKHIIVFSPFIMDVERGATVGIAISSGIKPYFNRNTLRESTIMLNEIILRVSKQYVGEILR